VAFDVVAVAARLTGVTGPHVTLGVGAGIFDLIDRATVTVGIGVGVGVGVGVFDLPHPDVGLGVVGGLIVFGAHVGSLLCLPSLLFLQRRSCSMWTV
jgi:hypothetical protein